MTRILHGRVLEKVLSFSSILRNTSPLSVAVLGPGLQNSEDPWGAKKRRQIYDALQQEGHAPFFPEQLVARGTPGALIEEREILRESSVDWILLLHTRVSAGTLMELSLVLNFPELAAKTTVLFPTDYYDPYNALAANSVHVLEAPPLLYTDHQLSSCSLVAECKALATVRCEAKSSLNWPLGHLPLP